MDARVEVLDSEISAAFKLLSEGMAKRLAERENKAYPGMDDVYEEAAEEFDVELMKAMHERKPEAFAAESVNVAVTMVLGVASVLAARRAPDAEDRDVATSEISAALKRLSDNLVKRLSEKGRKSFMGMAEIYGTAAEELKLELLQALMDKKPDEFMDEAVDVAVAMVFGVASLLARKRHEAANPAARKGR